MNERNGKLIVLITGVLMLAACGKEAPPPQQPPKPAPAASAPPVPTAAAPAPAPAGTTFESLVLGTAVDASGKLTGAPTLAFTPKDTIYAVVTTNNAGAAPATIAAHWAYQGTSTVSDSSQTVTAPGQSVTAFHIEKPSGWPTGAYTVAISIDGKQVGMKDFDVK
ncbi:MAG TPA: hypothetical protein VGH81_08330 [Rudaea sp.]|jgi:hypothetical protein